METKVAERIVELARQWQERNRWLGAFHAAVVWREQENKAWSVAECVPTDDDTTIKFGGNEATRHAIKAERAHHAVAAASCELDELADLLRHHAPKLLSLVPMVNFCDAPPDDLLPWLERMQEIEGAIRGLLAPETPADTTATNASVEQRALAVLVNHPDWTVRQIAAEVGTRREYLSSKAWPKFKAARAVIRVSSIPAGTKSKDGTIEAVDDDFDFESR